MITIALVNLELSYHKMKKFKQYFGGEKSVLQSAICVDLFYLGIYQN